MAERELVGPDKNLRPRVWAHFIGSIVGLFCIWIGLSGALVRGQPPHRATTHWKQSIERPDRTWDYDGKRILGHLGSSICLWDATTGDLLQKMEGHEEKIHAVQFSPDSEYAISSSWIKPGPMVPLKSKDTRTVLWNLSTGRSKHDLPAQVAGEFSPDGKRIVTFSQRPEEASGFDASIWDVSTGRELVKLKLDEDSGPQWDSLHFSPDGRRVVYFGNGAFLLYNSSKAAIYDAAGRDLGRIAAKRGIHRYISSGAVAVFDSENVVVTDIESGRTVQFVEHGLKANWLGAWTHDGRKVAAFPPAGDIKIWDVETGKTITGVKCGPYPQKAAIVSPDNALLAILSGGSSVEDKEIEPEVLLCDLKTGKEVFRSKLGKEGRLIGFSPDSETLLVGGSEFIVFNSKSGEKLRAVKLKDEIRILKEPER